MSFYETLKSIKMDEKYHCHWQSYITSLKVDEKDLANRNMLEVCENVRLNFLFGVLPLKLAEMEEEQKKKKRESNARPTKAQKMLMNICTPLTEAKRLSMLPFYPEFVPHFSGH